MIDEENIFGEIMDFVTMGFEVRLRTINLRNGLFYEIHLSDFRNNKFFTACGLDSEIRLAWERVKIELKRKME